MENKERGQPTESTREQEPVLKNGHPRARKSDDGQTQRVSGRPSEHRTNRWRECKRG